jgi:predicted RNA-binding protein YlqC (UPF0109 family)
MLQALSLFTPERRNIYLGNFGSQDLRPQQEPLFMEDIQIKELVEYIARCLAEHPEQVIVKEIAGEQISVIELRAAKNDLGKIIGREGRNADALRTILNAAATKLKKRAVLEILE